MKKESSFRKYAKHLLRGIVKSIPFVGPLLEQVIYGTRDEEKAEKESQELLETIRFKTVPETPLPPGSLHNLPFVSLGDLFKGRDEILGRLDEQLKHTQVAAITQPRAIYGLGGGVSSCP